MGSHPLNLIFRFILELCALTSVGFFGWTISNEWYKYIFALLFPIILSVIWGVYNVPNDPSRSGKAPIPISGIIRLIIEFGIFTIAILTLYLTGYINLSIAFGILVIIHYVLSIDRIKWLISQ